jgi:hypothetical protein
MTRAYDEAPASHYRLSPETWAIIGEEYRNGAMAKDVAAKWKTSPSSVYRHACQDGWTKKSMGDARARAHARMVEAEEEGARALHPVGSRALKNLFAPAPTDDPEASDPTALARTATLASGRAMKGRLWNEAKALAGLAESYARLAGRAGPGGVDNRDQPEPDEAAFEAVRRKVLGWTDAEMLSRFGLESGDGAGEGEPSPISSGTASPRP